MGVFGVAGLGADLVDCTSTGIVTWSVDTLSESIESSSITSNFKGLGGLLRLGGTLEMVAPFLLSRDARSP